jgi:hypothetical protein
VELAAVTAINVLATGISVELAAVAAINVLAPGISMELADAAAVRDVLATGVSSPAFDGTTDGRR